MNKNEDLIEDIKSEYLSIKERITKRLDEFRRIWNEGSEEDIFVELIFCILTPQSKAKICWVAIENICDKKLLKNCLNNKICNELTGVRFKYKKSSYILMAIKQFKLNKRFSIKSKLAFFKNPNEVREWLTQNVLGLGYKEASHFLRNIGLGNDLAILDRHILKNLKLFGVIDEIPKSISKRRYLDIEKKMKEFANQIDIPLSHLDLLFWYKETGEVFK